MQQNLKKVGVNMATKKLLEKFIGEYVDVLTEINVSLKNETEDGTFQKEKPYVISGYFTDFDENYLYLGAEENTISDAINLDYIVHVGVSTPFDKYANDLDDSLPDSEDSWS